MRQVTLPGPALGRAMLSHWNLRATQWWATATQPAAGEMATLDEAVTRVLGEEAMRAPAAGGTVRRLLNRHRRLRPTTVQWFVPTVIATVVAVAFSVLIDGPRASQVAARPLPSWSQSAVAWTDASTQPRQSGHLDMAYNGVHVLLDAGKGPGYWFGSWQRPCPQSLLAPSVGRIPSSAACGLQARSEPLWEILVSPGYATVPIQPARLQWAMSATRTYTPRFVDDLTVDGHPVWVSSVTGKARYPCRQRCNGWLHRIWTSIYFPERDAQVSILAPNYAGIAWLTDRIEVD